MRKRGRCKPSLLLAACMATGAVLPGHAAESVVRGRIVDLESGAPLASDVLVLDEEREQTRADRTVERRYVIEPIARVATDAEGQFELKLPQYRRVRVDAVAPGHARKSVGFVDTGRPDVLLPPGKLAAGGTVEGSVVDAGGEPVSGAFVHTENEKVWGVSTNEAGAFVMEGIPLEGMAVRVRAPGYAPLLLDKVVPGTRVLATLGRGTTITGKLVDRAGRPALAVEVLRADDPLGARARTDASGTFVLQDMGSGTIVLATRSAAFQSTTLRCTPPECAVATLAPAARAEVHVVDARSKRPIARARVASTIPGRRTFRYDSLIADDAGVVLVGGLSEATTMLVALATGYIGDNSGERLFRASETTRLTIELSPEQAIEGRVVAEDGTPVAEAQIDPFVPTMGSLFRGRESTVTDGSGSFRLRGLENEDHVLRVSARGFAQKEVPVGRGQKAPRIVLERGGSARGRVLSPEGQPLAGVSVLAYKQDDSDFGDPLESTTSDAAGAYVLDALPEGAVEIRAKHKGALDSLPVPVRIKRGDVATPGDAKLRTPGRIEGRVVDQADKPLAATASVRGTVDVEAPTNADGRFLLEGLEPDDEYVLSVVAEGYVKHYEEDLRPGSRKTLEIVLVAARRLRGRVIAESDGSPVTSFDFECAPGGSWRYEGVVRQKVSSPDGRFDVGGITAGTSELRIKAPGFLSATQKVDVTASGDSPELEIALKRGLSISGVVRDASGKPIKDAFIHVYDHEPSSWDLKVMRGSAGSLTGPDGTFHAKAVPPGKVFVVASAEGHQITTLALEMTTSLTAVELVMRAGARLTGRVLGLDGLPIANASVALAEPSVIPMGFTMFGEQQLTDESGGFTFEGVEPGRYEMQASGSGGLLSEVVQVTAAATSPAPVTLRLQGGARVKVTVTGLEESDLERLDVRAIGAQGSIDAVGEGATFVLENVHSGNVEIIGSLPGRTAIKNVAVSEKDSELTADLSFEGTGRLSGAITRAGKPVPGIGVSVGRDADADGVVGETRTDDDGRYAVEGLMEGSQGVWLTLDGGMPEPRPWNVVIAGDTHLDIALPSGTVLGRVTDAGSASPIEGARVTVLSGEGSSMLDIVSAGVTDTTGRFRVEGVPDGEVRCSVWADGYALPPPAATRAGAEPLEITLEREASLRLHIVDRRTGAPPQQAIACFVDGAGRISPPMELVTDGDDFKVPGVTTGVADLLLLADDAAPVMLRQLAVPGEASVGVSGGGTLGINLRDTAAIQLRSADGSLTWLMTSSDISTMVTASAPRRELPVVAPGSYRVIATRNGKSIEVPVIIVEGETATVTLP